ncbi:regulatory protein [Azospira sp. I13]|uniref:Crp/Fnr family transcriptional regulator n=1 Tax=Azospira sp. I13 TaxID=1765050 RepID=UPI000D4A5DB8|nr:Crp/Fnr family transcriptional regulator [Azospira sp. I13]GBG03045.1 regulatory protein [Azospira sp. I13]
MNNSTCLLPPENGTPDPRIIAQLRETGLFAELEAPDLERLARGVREVEAGRGDILFHKGDPCRGFHLLLAGQVKLAFNSTQGNEKVVELIHPGQTFGEAVMFMEKPYPLFAQALARSRLLHISKLVLFQEMDQDPLLCRKMIGSLSRRLHHRVVDVEAYSLQSGWERIVGFLLRGAEAPEAGSDCPRQAVVRLPSSKGNIASRLNLTQEHFSRILHDLAGRGLVLVDGRTIHIPDVEQLRQASP